MFSPRAFRSLTSSNTSAAPRTAARVGYVGKHVPSHISHAMYTQNNQVEKKRKISKKCYNKTVSLLLLLEVSQSTVPFARCNVGTIPGGGRDWRKARGFVFRVFFFGGKWQKSVGWTVLASFEALGATAPALWVECTLGFQRSDKKGWWELAQ